MWLRALAMVGLFAAGARAQFPPPPAPPGNPGTPDQVLLGKALFWDEQLSSTRTVACGTCHSFATGGGDPRAGAVHPGLDGVFGTPDDRRTSFGVVHQDAQGVALGDPSFGADRQVTPRRAPSPIHAAYLPELFWDGRASGTFRDPLTQQVLLPAGAALESQALGPPVNPVEMAHAGRTWSQVAADLAGQVPLRLASNVPAPLAAFVQGRTYAQVFQQVYGSPGVTPARIAEALAAYQRTLIADQSYLDLAQRGQHTLTLAEQLGQTAFVALCATCHTDVLPATQLTGPVQHDFRNIGVSSLAEDPGRFLVTQQPADQGRFKVPGLRNVALRAPYFHDGSAADLVAVVDFYRRGGDFHTNQDPLVANIVGSLSTIDRGRIVAFLQALTDPRVAAELPPFDRPRLWSEGPQANRTFGTGTAGSGGLPPRALPWSPGWLGNPQVVVGLTDTAPGALAFLAFDLAAAVPAQPVLGHAVHLAMTPALAVAPGQGLTLGAAPGGGFTSFRFALPPDPGFAGFSLFGQWLVVDPLGPVGFGSSNGFELPLF